MLRNLFTLSGIISFLLRLPCVLIAISVHESAHGLAAEKMGDPTARACGRITMNPLKHFDLWGTLCLVFFGFGWANPVPINPRNFRDPKKGMALSALAGPVSNLLLALIGVLLYRITLKVFLLTGIFVLEAGTLYYAITGFGQTVTDVFLTFEVIFISLNVGYAVFNMIPCPPLDGSRIFLFFLPEETYFKIMRYERYLMIAFFVVLYIGLLDKPLSLACNGVEWAMNRVVDLIPFLRI